MFPKMRNRCFRPNRTKQEKTNALLALEIDNTVLLNYLKMSSTSPIKFANILSAGMIVDLRQKPNLCIANGKVTMLRMCLIGIKWLS